ncbi:hypothetical protein [Robinsoniella peoriensis]|nr:MAG TPA: hypothetical protein [Caudoviricetes sp.]
MNEIKRLIIRLQERAAKEQICQYEAVAFSEGWLQTLCEINPGKSFTSEEIHELFGTLSLIKK